MTKLLAANSWVNSVFLYQLDDTRYFPALVYGKKKNPGIFPSSLLSDSIIKTSFTILSPEIQGSIFADAFAEHTVISFVMGNGEKILFMILEASNEINEPDLFRLSDTVESISTIRKKRFSVFPETPEPNPMVFHKILLKSGITKGKYIVLFKIDMAPFVSYYKNLYPDVDSAVFARDAFSTISTSINANGILFSADGEKALAVLYSKTAHDPQMIADQIHSIFNRVVSNRDQYKPVFGSFANFNIDNVETKQGLLDYLDELQE